MKKNILKGYALVLTIAPAVIASDKKDWVNTPVPPILPSEQKAIVDTYVPDSCYRFTKNADEAVSIGPCSPCAAIKVRNVGADEWLYFHHHKMNNPKDVGQKIVQHFTPAIHGNKPDLDYTIFTRSDPSSVLRFPEGTHEDRIGQIAKEIAESGTVINQTIHFNETRNPLAHGYVERNREIGFGGTAKREDGYSDRTILFAGNKPSYRLAPRGELAVLYPTSSNRLAYLADCMLQICPDRVRGSAPNSIWNSYNNVPLYEIKEPNLEKIKGMPYYAPGEDPISLWMKR